MESDQSLIVGGLISSTQNKTDSYFLSSVQTGISDTSNRTEIILIVHVQIMPEKNIENWFDVLAKKYDNQEIKVN
jgi:predicted patatin/cPLA2 family phospholipase